VVHERLQAMDKSLASKENFRAVLVEEEKKLQVNILKS